MTCLSYFAQGQRSAADSVFLSRESLGDIETIDMVSMKDPNKAAMLSAVLPGLGQAYNNQYWKIPLIYSGAIILGHYINYNHRIYHEFRTALIAEIDGDPTTENPYKNTGYSQTYLTRYRDLFRRNRDFLMIIGAAYYLLNIVDAHVSAHLLEFDVNDKLSMEMYPSIQSTPLFSHAIGVSVTFRVR